MKSDIRDTRRLPAEVLARLQRAGLDAPGLELRDDRGRVMVAEARATPGIELRAKAENSTVVPLAGYATRYGNAYEVMGGKDSGWGWDETVMVGAAAKSIGERDDVRFLFNHDGPAFARTKSGTMTLASDQQGLLVNADIDTSDTDAANMVRRIQRGDLDQMSFAFQVTRQEWNEDYTERFITEVKLFDVSAVTYPANEATSLGVGTTPPDPGELEPDPLDPLESIDPPAPKRSAAEELERRGFALVEARALLDLAR